MPAQTKEKILIVEDDEASASIIRRMVEEFGYQVAGIHDRAENALAALEEFAGKDAVPDLVLMDIQLAGEMNGIQAARAIEGKYDCALIFTTAYSQVEIFEQAFQTKPYAYLVKPFKIPQIHATLKLALHQLALEREIKARERERGRMEMRLRQTQKMKSIGQLAAGLAHEINTPIQSISHNMAFLKDSFDELADLARGFREMLDGNGAPAPETLEKFAEKAREADLDYLFEETPKAIRQSAEGLARVAAIIRAMREFSRPGGSRKIPVNLNAALANTVTVTRSEWKDTAEIKEDYDPELPEVPALPAEINQVFLQLIINAAHAIADLPGNDGGPKGAITLTTRRRDGAAEVAVADNGPGIPENIRDKIFDMFFTTRDVGQGMGQGLAVAYDIVVHKHGGSLDFETEAGRGTTFRVRLPLESGN